MRNLNLSILSILALLIYPLSLSAQNSFSLSLDVNGAADNQAVTSLNVSADQVVAIQIFGTGIQNANGLAVRFEYNASQVTYEGFGVGNVLPNAQALIEQSTNPTYVEIGIASLGGQATANSGQVGTVRFRAIAAFSGTVIRLVRAELGRGGHFETITLNTRVELKFQAVTPDFDRDGVVGIPDFLLFVNHFGTSFGDASYDAKYDLDGNGVIGIPDFLIFVDNFVSQVSPSGGGSSTGIVDIPDANLRAVIANRLGKASGAPITRAEMATLTRIDATNQGIRNLTGLEHATNLQRLDLDRSNISDISALSNLTNLIYLDLSYNSISDISALYNLTNLTHLNFFGNSISDISALSNLINLETWYLGQNSISDISALYNLTNLKRLYLNNNSISDISALYNLTNLTNLSLFGNSISDISALSNLANLTLLRLQDNNISDISPLLANTGLGSGDTVDLRSNPLSSTSTSSLISILLSRGVTVRF